MSYSDETWYVGSVCLFVKSLLRGLNNFSHCFSNKYDGGGRE